MTTVYDTSTEVDTAEAERLLRRPAKQVRNLWRDEARSPLDRARKGLSW